MATLDELRHLAVEKRQQQGADVGSIDIRVGHYDDSVVAKIRDLEVISPDSAAKCRDQGANLRGREHLVETRLLDVQNLALEGKDRLGSPIATLFCGSAGRVTLDQKQLREGRILLLAIGQLPWKTRKVQSTLAPSHLARLAGGFTRASCLNNFRHDGARILRALEQKFLQSLGNCC